MPQSQTISSAIQVTPAEVNVLGSAPMSLLKALFEQRVMLIEMSPSGQKASWAKLFDEDFGQFLAATQNCLQMTGWVKALVSTLSHNQQNVSTAYDKLLNNLNAAFEKVSTNSKLLNQQLLMLTNSIPELEGAIRVGERAIRAASRAYQLHDDKELANLKALIEKRVSVLNTALTNCPRVKRLLMEESCVYASQLSVLQDIRTRLAELFAEMTLARFCKNPEVRASADIEASLFITETRVYKQLRELHSHLQLEQLLRSQSADFFTALAQLCEQ